MIRRESAANGTIWLKSNACTYSITRIRPGVLHVVIAGRETGELGRALLGEVAAEAALHPPLQVFFDMSELTHVVEHIADDWTAWFRANKSAIRRVDVLAPATLVRLTVAVSQMFSGMTGLMQIHTETTNFDKALRTIAQGKEPGRRTGVSAS